MKRFLISATCLGALALTYGSTAAVADEHDIVNDNESVVFSELTLANGTPDDGTCAERYGSTGYRTTGNSETSLEQTENVTVDGHDIVISSTGGTIGDGILSIENEYEITFPNDENKEPIEVKIFATGLFGSGSASGVFSDGTCRGKVTISAE
ncbi:hypothetical protein GCM10007094_26280 [Pseudovibrio japonicus]|uniref:Secreted protein n=1 Tax=Pseudovibrio japonicus TaxID=366534 RepID=A0ABQ3EG51_9HYPH|nr:hypothetical protein [Pseudovibrio japonicus]GHB35454.1 hypothetical protein GCM10007094_26280 [Pseudovibrio japonicus]